ncbi:biotin synthesis protein [Actinobacillus equuli]|nr:biotin synthesis protein [Actinobacillus equuli]
MSIISGNIFLSGSNYGKLDKPLIAQRFATHITEYDEHAIAQQQINRQLVNLLAQTNKQCFGECWKSVVARVI